MMTLDKIHDLLDFNHRNYTSAHKLNMNTSMFLFAALEAHNELWEIPIQFEDPIIELERIASRRSSPICNRAFPCVKCGRFIWKGESFEWAGQNLDGKWVPKHPYDCIR